MTAFPTTTQAQLPMPADRNRESSDGGAISFGDVIAILRQRMVLIVALWVLFGAIAVGLWLLFWIKFPTYTSEAWIECVSDNPGESLSIAQRDPEKDVYERFAESQALFVKAPEILDRALQTPEVQSTTWYRETREDIRRLELEDELYAGHRKGTNYVVVSMGCRDRNDPRIIVNQVVRAYLTTVMDAGVSPFERELSTIRDEHNKLKSEIADKRKRLLDFAKDNLQPGVLFDNPGSISSRLVYYAEQVAMLETATRELEGLYQIYTDPTRPIDFSLERAEVEIDPQIGNLVGRQLNLEQQIAVATMRFGRHHRTTRNLQQELDVVVGDLTPLREQKLNEIVALRREQIATAYQNSQTALLAAMDELMLAEAEQKDQDTKLAQYLDLVEELDWLREQSQELNKFILDLERVVQSKNAIQIRVAKRAVDPLEKSAPATILLPAGVVFAGMLAMGVAVALSLLDTSVRTPQDIVRHINIPLLGAVPDLDDEEVHIECIETAVRDAPHSMVVEAFRTIRTNLQFSGPADRQRSILVTSPSPEDGKTTVACNLAASVALGGRRVLLVDANLRRPALQKFHENVDGSNGLSNMLVGNADLASTIKKTSLPNLDVIGSGPLPPNPAELLGSPQMRSFLQEMSATYDQIFFDAPPVLLANDALVLSTLVDGVILVCRAKQNSRGMTQRACGLLQKVEAHILGGVLNAVQVQRGGYFREQLRRYYDYSEELISHTSTKPKLPEGDSGK
ncbi:MAG: polysaccharide biosynthesis tyrosine autokinase [Planctomycetes bacterium]|nr:polysaccharide biosynthesis tyrosine autokinase [Planctomycetota bacterium]